MLDMPAALFYRMPLNLFIVPRSFRLGQRHVGCYLSITEVIEITFLAGKLQFFSQRRVPSERQRAL